MRLSALLVLALGACGTPGKTDTGTDLPTDDVEDSDELVHTDAIGETDAVDETDTPVDTDDTDTLVDTDETDTPVDTDDTDAPVDTDDTDAPVDTDDTDTPVDTDETDTPVDTDDTDTPVDTDETDTPVDTDETDTTPVDTGPFDVDGDFVPARDDCDDEDATVYPGAPQLCDGRDRSCGLTPVDPVGTAALRTAAGAWSDVTATLGSGTPAAPYEPTVGTGETLRLCGGSWAIRVGLPTGASLIGVDAAELATDGPYTMLSTYGDGALVQGVTLRSASTDLSAVAEVDAGTATFDDVDVVGGVNGLALTGSGDLTMIGGSITEQTGNGVQLWGGGGARIALTDTFLGDIDGTALVVGSGTTADVSGVTVDSAALGVSISNGTLSMTSVDLDVDRALDGSGTATATLLDVAVGPTVAVSTWYGEALTVEDSTFSGGKGWLVSASGDVSFVGCRFSDLDAGTGWGGALFLGDLGTPVTVTVDDCTFEDGHAQYGGAIFTAIPVDVRASVFERNAADSGGAIYASSSAEGTTITGGTFSENTAGWGGAVDAEGGLTVDAALFDGNIATSSGGAVATGYAGDATLVVSNATFSGNQAPTGGAVSAADLASLGNLFTDNVASAGQGGAVLIACPSSCTLEDDTFLRNAASTAGGALAWTGDFSATDVVFGTGVDADLPEQGAYATTPVPLSSGTFHCSGTTCN